MEHTPIRLVRPLQTEYIVVGGFLMNWQNAIYNLTESQFVGECMRLAGGSLNPNKLKQIYNQLMDEAGLKHDKEKENTRPVGG